MPTDRALLDARRALNLVTHMTDLDGVVRPNQKPTTIDFYCYNTTLPTLNPLSTVNGIIQTQSDSDFVVCSMSGVIASGDLAISMRSAFLQLTDLSDGKTLFNAPASSALLFGNLGYPYVLPCPRVWKPNTNIRITASSIFAGSGVQNIDLSFSGMRIYYA